MNSIEKSYKLRNEFLSQPRIFSDDFLLNLYDCIEDEKDKERYIDILNTEFRGDIPNKFIEVIKMNENYNTGRTALTQTIAEMYHELIGADIGWTYTALSKFTDTELIEFYGLIYDYYCKEE